VSSRRGREQLPAPPSEPPGELPDLSEETLSSSWRIHTEEDPRDPRRYPQGRWRFDAPAGEYAVTYVNLDPYAAFAEVYGDTRSIAPNQADRLFSSIWSERALRVVALDDPEVLAALGLDLRISAAVEYPTTMAWSRALHEWYPQADGIRYLGRHATIKLNYGLFLDRCAEDLDFATDGKLGDLRGLVLRAADSYNLAPRLFEERDRGTPL
jgi:hypothetical protein